MFLRGIRGATVSVANTQADILMATTELLEKIMAANSLNQADIASIFFSVTLDLNAAFPAVSARKMGLNDTPLLCFNEIAVPGSLPKCIRVLIHVNTDLMQADMVHVYLKDAVSLRPEHAAS